MSSTTKALELLTLFSTSQPEIGLSEMCRLAKRDKATTYRHLTVLEEAGFVEQNKETKGYRLGPALLQLGRMREITVPRKEGAKAALKVLADATGETAHVTVLSGTVLYALCECESPRHGTRAVIDITTFPLHATASGLCCVAFGSPDLLDAATANLESFTSATPKTRADVLTKIEEIRGTGFSHANRSYEAEIQGLAAPVFDHTGHLAGAVAVASVASRFTDDLERTIRSELIIAAREISRNWGGTSPASLEAAWAKSVTHPNALEPTS